MDEFAISEEQWRERLTPEQYRVLRRAGTELPYSGIYASSHEPGIYRCAACGQALFSSSTKFESGTGWPSFFAPVSEEAVTVRRDWKMILPRLEARCGRCGSHLGHVFSDGPRPTGKRWCINSVALDLDWQSPPT